MADENEARPKSRVFARLASILLIVAFGAAGLFLQFHNQRKLAPPADGKTFTEFAAKMPAPKHLGLVDDNDAKTVIWIGEQAAFPAVSSGPACYQFDLAGNLIDWCPETREGHRLDRLAEAALAQPSKSVEEVTKELKPQSAGPAETTAN